MVERDKLAVLYQEQLPVKVAMALQVVYPVHQLHTQVVVVEDATQDIIRGREGLEEAERVF